MYTINESQFDSDSFSEYDILPTNEILKRLNIFKARCDKFIPSKESKSDNDDPIIYCGCGKKLEQHSNYVIENYNKYGIIESEKWSPNSCTIEDGLTDAFGEIKFLTNSENTAKYIRVHYKTSMDKIMNLFKVWKLKDPNLLISVTGGAQKFVLKPRLTQAFRKGLVKAAASTGAWIITGGLYTGVMKHVGEAVREYETTFAEDNDRIVVLGIATWTKVAGTQYLVKANKESEYVAKRDYNLNLLDADKKGKKQALDPNHSHFILVDNAKDAYGGEIEFRGLLESEITKMQVKNCEDTIPIIVIVVEGGIGTIHTVYESIKNGSPCLFVEGSGKCADLFSKAIRKLSNLKKVDGKFEQELKDALQKEWGDKDIALSLEYIKFVLEHSHLLSVFRLGDDDQEVEIDVAILKALLKAKEGHIKLQIKLAFTWNRIDILKDFLKTVDVKLKPDDFNDIMFEALLENRVESVRLILTRLDFGLKSFITKRRLLKLYNTKVANQRNTKNEFYALMSQRYRKSIFSFREIGEVIQALVDDIYEPYFLKKPYKYMEVGKIFEKQNGVYNGDHNLVFVENGDPVLDGLNEHVEHDLFIYSVLHGRFNMAKLFWQEGKNEIISALVASKIFESYADIFTENSDEFDDYSYKFRAMAFDVLQRFYDKDDLNAQNLVIRAIKLFDNLTPLQFAVQSNDMKFVSHPSTQKMLTRIWYNKIVPDISIIPILLSVIFPPIAPAFIEYLEDRSKNINDEKDAPDSAKPLKYKRNTDFTDSGRALSYWEKVYSFIKAPIVKFIFDQIFYILLLALFSYVMLCDFFPFTIPNKNNAQDPTFIGNVLIGIPEIVLIIWIFTYAIEELRQFFQSETRLLRAKLRSLLSMWSFLKISRFLLFIVGLVLRFIPNNYQCYLAARIILCVDLVLWYFKTLTYYTVMRNLGPKIVMIQKMVLELVQFIFIVIVFMFAFGVTTQSIMFHNQLLNSNLLFNVFFPSYFIIGGEYFTRDSIMQAAQGACNAPKNATSYDQSCAEQTGSNVTLALYVIYLIVLDILLVNLLIAIFARTYEKIQSDSDEIWKFQRYRLIYEYYHRPTLCQPFTIILYPFYFVRLVLRFFRAKCCPSLKQNEGKNIFMRLFLSLTELRRSGFRIEFNDPKDEAKLIRLESYVADEYVYRKEEERKDTDTYKIQEIYESIEQMAEKQTAQKERLDSMEENISKIFEILSNMSKGNEITPAKTDTNVLNTKENGRFIDVSPRVEAKF